MDTVFLPRESLQQLVELLQGQGFDCVGPKVKQDAITYQHFDEVSELSFGYQDEQAPGRYALKTTSPQRLFDVTTGPQGLKPLVFKSRENLWRSQRSSNGEIDFSEIDNNDNPVAFFGARACDLAALRLQDRHFIPNENDADSHYQQNRENLFIIGVNCSRSADTCFCQSMGTGPEIKNNTDITLSELDEGFVVHSTSLRARLILDELNLELAAEAQIKQAQKQLKLAATQQRKMPGLEGVLRTQAGSPEWDKIAQQCLSCGNCTAVCPSCFCNNQRDEATLDGNSVTHFREWDSCFNEQHSYIHGIVIREQTGQRYRQWLTHKLDTWHDQYGESGCVGCGRCISWCPVGIDITQVAKQFVESVNE